MSHVTIYIQKFTTNLKANSSYTASTVSFLKVINKSICHSFTLFIPLLCNDSDIIVWSAFTVIYHDGLTLNDTIQSCCVSNTLYHIMFT